MMKSLALLPIFASASACAVEMHPHETKAAAAAALADGKSDSGADPCADNGWYGDGTCDQFCPKHDPDCGAPPLGPDPHGAPAQLPIVLAHGYRASSTRHGFAPSIVAALRADGHRVYVDDVPAFDSADVRAHYLAATVDQALAETGAAQVTIIAHSMGGLDARALVSTLGYGDRVANIITISTPHRGSAFADALLGLVQADPGLANALADMFSDFFSNVHTDPHVDLALADISEASSAQWNTAHPDDPRVRYQSWAGVSTLFGLTDRADAETAACDGWMLRAAGTADDLNPLLAITAMIVGHGFDALPNDGLVLVSSAHWGAFRGCFPADHAREIGDLGTDHLQTATGFDPARFYRNLAFELSSQGY
jgi:triacylglycerol lipase